MDTAAYLDYSYLHMEDVYDGDTHICRRWWGEYDPVSDAYSVPCFLVSYSWTDGALDSVSVDVFDLDGGVLRTDFIRVGASTGPRKNHFRGVPWDLPFSLSDLLPPTSTPPLCAMAEGGVNTVAPATTVKVSAISGGLTPRVRV